MDLSIDAVRGSRELASWVPGDACTLPTPARPLRVAEFDALFAETLREVEHRPGSPTAVRLVLVGDEGLAGRVRQLCEAEASCCSFFTFVVTPLPQTGNATAGLALDIEVPPAHADVLAALVERAEQVRRAAA